MKGMIYLKKTENIIIRVTEEQHRIIKEEAEENNTTISALLLTQLSQSKNDCET